VGATKIVGMNSPSHLQDRDLHDRASELAEAARSFQGAAEAPASHAAAPDSLAALEEALQVLSGAWYQLAADASSGIDERRRARHDGCSREREAHLMATLHDVAGAFARCARACRDARSTVTPIIDRRPAATEATDEYAGDELGMGVA
jgi:hypothetical protein